MYIYIYIYIIYTDNAYICILNIYYHQYVHTNTIFYSNTFNTYYYQQVHILNYFSLFSLFISCLRFCCFTAPIAMLCNVNTLI